MFRVTFYSYKGGVGRTLALLGVGRILAESGRKVVAVDFDLEAPGFGLSDLTRAERGSNRQAAGPKGVSDYLLDILDGADQPLGSYSYPVLTEACEDRLRVFPAGTRSGELARMLRDLFRETDGPDALLFRVLWHEIDKVFRPDYLLFDSRTGLADIAGVCTLELPELLVVLSGLNEQSVAGTQEFLHQLEDHPVESDAGVLLVLSPVPRNQDLPGQPSSLASLEPEQRSFSPLYRRVGEVMGSLATLVQRRFQVARKRLPGLKQGHVYHTVMYDPVVPVIGETEAVERLASHYESLAEAISAASPEDTVLAASKRANVWLQEVGRRDFARNSGGSEHDG